MNKIRCKNCSCRFYPQKHIKNQRYCSRKECQTARKKTYYERKKRDKDYKARRKEIQKKWRDKNPHYWRQYKKDIAQNEWANKIKCKKPVLKILVKKSTLADLPKMGVINCDCKLIVTAK
jgi:hypothetical protein